MPSASGQRRALVLEEDSVCVGRDQKDGAGSGHGETTFPELIAALKEKYHYYIIGFALPEDCALLGCVGYLVMTNAPALAKVGLSVFGYSG
jgi:hypothetical protein